MPVESNDVLQGTLDMLILKALSLQPMHGWGVAQRIQQISRDVLQVNQGSLYPALHRLERAGLLRSSWAEHTPRQQRVYALTPRGEAALRERRRNWEAFAASMAGVLDTDDRHA
jgi:transcriptional regulator